MPAHQDAMPPQALLPPLPRPQGRMLHEQPPFTRVPCPHLATTPASLAPRLPYEHPRFEGIDAEEHHLVTGPSLPGAADLFARSVIDYALSLHTGSLHLVHALDVVLPDAQRQAAGSGARREDGSAAWRRESASSGAECQQWQDLRQQQEEEQQEQAGGVEWLVPRASLLLANGMAGGGLADAAACGTWGGQGADAAAAAQHAAAGSWPSGGTMGGWRSFSLGDLLDEAGQRVSGLVVLRVWVGCWVAAAGCCSLHSAMAHHLVRIV